MCWIHWEAPPASSLQPQEQLRELQHTLEKLTLQDVEQKESSYILGRRRHWGYLELLCSLVCVQNLTARHLGVFDSFLA